MDRMLVSIMTLSITAMIKHLVLDFAKTTVTITTICIMLFIATLCKNDSQHNDSQHMHRVSLYSV